MRVAFPLLFLLAAACDPRVGDVLGLPGDAATGEVLYTTECADCHAPDGTGGDGGPAIDHAHGRRATVHQMLYGGADMPAFADALSDQQVADLYAHLDAHIFSHEH
ncbi:MAG: cytochrome c [Proteobacteria bacterium]|nr:cytochrome c [Pseudomonadota bacterium]